MVHDPKPPCTVTIDSVFANSKTQNTFLFTVNAIFLHDYPLAMELGSTPRPLVQKKTWRDSLPIDMLLSAVSVLVVAQSSLEIPEGLMNNPVYVGGEFISSGVKQLKYKVDRSPLLSAEVKNDWCCIYTSLYHVCCRC